MREGGAGIDYEQGDKSTDTENEYVIHINMNENEIETNRDTLYKVIE